MNRVLKSIGKTVFSRGEQTAILALLSELRISHFHRQGTRLIRRSALHRPSRLNLGCGKTPKPGFLNVDMQPPAQLTLDLRRGLPFEDGCCELVFSEHFFEHVDYPQPISRLLADCLRVLQPGGTLSFSVPDTEWPLHDYGKGDDAPYFRACRDNSWWHAPYCTTRIEHINYHFRQDGEHRFAYDFETAKKLLEAVGFTHVAQREFDPLLDSEHRKMGSLFISARKAS